MKAAVLTLLLIFAGIAPAAAQLVGTDTTPGSSCAGFPDGATRVTADADLDGEEVTLICDGTNWLPVAGGGAIESVGGLSAPPASPTCTQRTATNSLAATTVSCIAGEIMTGGGCRHSSTTYTMEDSGPSAADTWSCEWNTAGATSTAYAICCAF